MPFEFLDDDLVVLGVGPFADEFRAEAAGLSPRPGIIDVRQHPFAGEADDPLIEEMRKYAPGRLLLVGNLGNLQHVGPFPPTWLKEIFKQEVPGGCGPSRLALLEKYTKRLGFRSTALRHVIRSGQEGYGCLTGSPEPGADVEELQSFMRMQHLAPLNPDSDALILRSGGEDEVRFTTMARATKVVERFGAGEARTITYVCRRCTTDLEARYIPPEIVAMCAKMGYERLTFVGGNLVFVNWPRVRRACRQAGLRLYRFYD